MKTLLVPVDFSDVTPDLLATAAKMVKALAARVVLVHVVAPEPEFIGYEPGPQSVRNSVARDMVQERRALHDAEAELVAKGVEVTALTLQGYPVEKIVAEAERQSADMLIMGSHGHGALYQLLVGSVTEGVMRRVNCPVLVVPHRKR
jgi:nucleotide-binding universal stress UspA family protein